MGEHDVLAVDGDEFAINLLGGLLGVLLGLLLVHDLLLWVPMLLVARRLQSADTMPA